MSLEVEMEVCTPSPHELIELHKEMQQQCETFFKELSWLQTSLEEAIRLLSSSPSQPILRTFLLSLPQFHFECFTKERKDLSKILWQVAEGKLDVSLALRLVQIRKDKWEDKSED